jgi:hypothetical protein
MFPILIDKCFKCDQLVFIAGNSQGVAVSSEIRVLPIKLKLK